MKACLVYLRSFVVFFVIKNQGPIYQVLENPNEKKEKKLDLKPTKREDSCSPPSPIPAFCPAWGDSPNEGSTSPKGGNPVMSPRHPTSQHFLPHFPLKLLPSASPTHQVMQPSLIMSTGSEYAEITPSGVVVPL